MHIADQIAHHLIATGWTREFPTRFAKRIDNFAEPGAMTDGARVVRLDLDVYSGRWLSRLHAWGGVERDVDLRNYKKNPEGAVNAVLRL